MLLEFPWVTSIVLSLSEFNQPIGNRDVSAVTSMIYMFSISAFNQPIGDWDVSGASQVAEEDKVAHWHI
jgi:hypothetical protein